MRQIAKSKGGKCIKQTKPPPKRRFAFECSEGHVWDSSSDSIKSGHWCPQCNKFRYLNEDKCRYILESLLDKKFPSNRRILDNHQELDGYCDDLKLAFEYNGKQHYERSSIFHKSQDDFILQKIRDQTKARICRDKKIKLIIIPYWISDDNKIDFIVNAVNKFGILINKDKIDVFSYVGFWKSKKKLKKCKEFIKPRGGKLLSEVYTGATTKMLWECSKKHQFTAAWCYVQQNHWCPFCSGRAGHDIFEMRRLAEKYEGKCLSEAYKGADKKLKWECKYEHQWKAVPASIKGGCWCPKCSYLKRGDDKKMTQAQLQKIAAENDGVHVGPYIRNTVQTTWKCKDSHIFKLTLVNIRRGSWCPICKSNKTYNRNRIIYKMKKNGLTYVQIGEKMNISRETVRTAYLSCNQSNPKQIKNAK